MPKDQRAFTRFNAEGNVVLKPQDGTSRTIKGDLLDICYLGMGVLARERIESGIHVKFELTIALSDETLIGEGKVKHAYEDTKDDARIFKTGIEFVNVDNKQVQNFLTIIQHDIIAKERNK